ncbi:MAG: glycosyltransferase family 39 protein [Thermodesulfovibrionales bacterium]
MNLTEIDLALFLLINQSLQNPLFDAVMPFVTNNGPLLMLPALLWLFATEKHGIWRPLLMAFGAVALADASSHLLKDLIARPRPCSVLEGVHLLVGCGRSFSMPSNHASNSFAFALALLLYRRSGPTFLLTGIALFVSVSRISVGVHYPADVLAGGVVGLAAALASRRIADALRSYSAHKQYGSLLVLIIGLVSLGRIYFILTGPYDLTPDEAHYWEWSRRLDWGYYSKGPMIAHLIAAGTWLFGDTVFGVRFPAVLFSGLGSWLLYRTGKDLFDEKTGFFSGLLLLFVPLFSVYGVVFTIDAPLIFFWLLSVHLFQKIVLSADRAGKVSFDFRWVLLGLSVGAGMLTKHSIALFFVTVFLCLLASKDRRWMLATTGPYIASLVTAAVYSPVIAWNASHDWVTFRHTAGQTHIAEGFAVSPEAFFDFVGSQIGVITPIVLALMLISLWRLRKDGRGSILFWLSAPILAFFLLKSCHAKVQANWALPGYLTGLIAFSASYLRDFGMLRPKMKGLVIAGILLSAAASAAPYAPSLVNRLPEKLDPTARLTGWKEIGETAGKIVEEMGGPEKVFLFSESYQVTSELAFYTPGQPVTYCFNNNRRMNQYDLWPGFETLVGRDALMVRQTVRGLPPAVAEAFGRCDREVIEIKARRGNRMKFTLFRCYDFKGITMKPIEKF